MLNDPLVTTYAVVYSKHVVLNVLEGTQGCALKPEKLNYYSPRVESICKHKLENHSQRFNYVKSTPCLPSIISLWILSGGAGGLKSNHWHY